MDSVTLFQSADSVRMALRWRVDQKVNAGILTASSAINRLTFQMLEVLLHVRHFGVEGNNREDEFAREGSEYLSLLVFGLK